MKYYVYILTNYKKTVLYIGFSGNLPQRIEQHKTGQVEGFTKKYKTNILIYFEEYDDVNVAKAREIAMKRWKRSWKEELINKVNPEWNEVSVFLKMGECIFCKIVTGKASSYKIYEDEKIIAILDHRPVREGATMLIPKGHYENFIDLPDDLAMHVVKIGNQIGRKIQEVLKPRRIGFAVAGFGVPHVHYHVVPMHHEHDITSGVYARCESGCLLFDMKNTPLADAQTQEKLRSLLSQGRQEV